MAQCPLPMDASSTEYLFLLDWYFTKKGLPSCILGTLGLYLRPLPTLPSNLWPHVPHFGVIYT